MAPAQCPVVVVGAGQAGAWAAITLRGLDTEVPITLIGDEAHPPYERPPLSKGILAGKAEIESAYIKPHDFYAANDIDLVLNRRVEGIDRGSKQIEFDDGSSLAYGTLVLATGARARVLQVPGADLPQVHVLRTIADVDRIKPRLAPGKRVVAIGAGFIGLEFAAVAVDSGCAVTVLDAAPQAMGRMLDAGVAGLIADSHRQKGVDLRLSVGIKAIEPKDDHVEILLADGSSVPADLVIVGIGAVPNCELAWAAGLECNDGVLVDAFGRTSDPAIFAVGDVTRHFNPLLDRHLRLESWQNAQNQAIAVAKVIAGTSEPYSDLPWFWTDQYQSNFQIVGVPAAWDRVVWRGDPAGGTFTAIYMADGRVVAGNAMNAARDIRPLKQMILSGRLFDPDLLADPANTLMQLAKG